MSNAQTTDREKVAAMRAWLRGQLEMAQARHEAALSAANIANTALSVAREQLQTAERAVASVEAMADLFFDPFQIAKLHEYQSDAPDRGPKPRWPMPAVMGGEG